MWDKMSPYIKDILDNGKPRCDFTKDQENLHRLGLSAIGLILHPDFFDLPVLPEDRFSQEGYFHTIEYLSDTVVFLDNNTKTQLATIYHVSRDPKTGHMSSYCPLFIMLKLHDINTWTVYVQDNTGAKPVTRILLTNVGDACTTDYPDCRNLKLSSLFSTIVN